MNIHTAAEHGAILRTTMTQRLYSVKGLLSNLAENKLNFLRVSPHELLLSKEIKQLLRINLLLPFFQIRFRHM